MADPENPTPASASHMITGHAGSKDVDRVLMGIARAFDRVGANPIDNLLALRIAFSSIATIAMQLGYPEHVETNRTTVLKILDELRSQIELTQVDLSKQSKIILPN